MRGNVTRNRDPQIQALSGSLTIFFSRYSLNYQIDIPCHILTPHPTNPKNPTKYLLTAYPFYVTANTMTKRRRRAHEPRSHRARKRDQLAAAGRYIRTTAHITPEQLIACIDLDTRYNPAACWAPPRAEDIRIGYLHGPSWYLAEGYTQGGRKRTLKRKVVELLYEHFYNDTLIHVQHAERYSMTQDIFYYHYLARKCKTAGCVNPHHYHKEIHMKILPHESYAVLKHCLITEEVITIPTGSKEEAQQLRAQLNNHTQKFKKEYPEHAAEISRYVYSATEHGLEIQPTHKGNYNRVKGWGVTTLDEPMPEPKAPSQATEDINELLKTATPMINPMTGMPIDMNQSEEESEEPRSMMDILNASKSDENKG